MSYSEKLSCIMSTDIKDGILLPHNSLGIFSHLDGPYYCKLLNEYDQSIVYNVKDFTAPLNTVIIPYKTNNEFIVCENSFIEVHSMKLEKGKRIKFKNIGEWDIKKLIDPICVLEKHLRYKSYIELNEIITIYIKELKREYKLIVTELEPNNIVSILNTDIDFSFTT